jgi:poly-D-alanine transfer protein DltD
LRRGWYKLADRLGQPVELLMRQTSSTQYLEWLEYMQTEPNDFHREDEYFKQILSVLYQLLYKNTGQASPRKPSDFQLKFTTERVHAPVVNKESSNSKWCTYVGLNQESGKGTTGDVTLDSFLDKII